MSDNLLEQLAVLPTNLANHLKISVVALCAGVALSLPLAILVVKRRTLRLPVLSAVSVIQTIPSLALLALMVPLLGAVSAFTASAFGLEFSALGFWPTVIALTLYSMLPVVRNTVTGITEVDPALIEAARGVGMTDSQRLWRVELPLALPVIIAGIRTATVWVVGIATLATPVGQQCLGNYIFSGLQTRNSTAVLVGCVAAALLAIVLDLLIGGMESGIRERRRSRTWGCGVLLAALVFGGIAAPTILRAGQEAPAPDAVIELGGKTFTEQYILVELIADVTEEAGLVPRKKESLGSTVVFDALAAGEIDCYVDYSGTIWANAMKREDIPDGETVLREMTTWLEEEHGIVCLGSLGFENAYGMAMRRAHVDELGITSLTELTPYAAGMKVGGDYEFFDRPEWRAVRDTYELSGMEQVSLDSTFMYGAVKNGDVDLISAFTSDGRIAAYDLAILDDPENALPPYDAVLLLSAEAARNDTLVTVLQRLVNRITVEDMREANFMVDRDDDEKQTVDEAAEWLREQALGK